MVVTVKGRRPDSLDPHGYTPLHLAAQSEDKVQLGYAVVQQQFVSQGVRAVYGKHALARAA